MEDFNRELTPGNTKAAMKAVGAKNKANKVAIRLAALFTEQTGFDTRL